MDIRINVAEYSVLDQTWNTETHAPWMRFIRFNRLYLPCKGEGLVEGYGRRFSLRKGKMLLVPSFAQVRVSCEKSLEKYWTHFNIYPDGGKHDIFAFRQVPMELDLEEREFSIFSYLFERMRQSFAMKRDKSTFLDDEPAKAALLLLVDKFLDQIADSTVQQKLPRIFEVISYMQSNLDKHISLTHLGKIAGLHPHYFSRLFKEIMGICPEQYIQRLRFIYAIHLLWDNSIPIGEVAETIGFSSVSSFSKFFRKQEGVGPQCYRKKILS